MSSSSSSLDLSLDPRRAETPETTAGLIRGRRMSSASTAAELPPIEEVIHDFPPSPAQRPRQLSRKSPGNLLAPSVQETASGLGLLLALEIVSHPADRTAVLMPVCACGCLREVKEQKHADVRAMEAEICWRSLIGGHDAGKRSKLPNYAQQTAPSLVSRCSEYSNHKSDQQKENTKPTSHAKSGVVELGKTISDWVMALMTLTEISTETIPLALVLLGRALAAGPPGTAKLTNNNWKAILFACLLVAHKFWDDDYLANRDFVLAWSGKTADHANEAERWLLRLLRWHVAAAPSMYAKAFFAIRASAQIARDHEGLGNATRAELVRNALGQRLPDLLTTVLLGTPELRGAAASPAQRRSIFRRALTLRRHPVKATMQESTGTPSMSGRIYEQLTLIPKSLLNDVGCKSCNSGALFFQADDLPPLLVPPPLASYLVDPGYAGRYTDWKKTKKKSKQWLLQQQEKFSDLYAKQNTRNFTKIAWADTTIILPPSTSKSRSNRSSNAQPRLPFNRRRRQLTAPGPPRAPPTLPPPKTATSAATEINSTQRRPGLRRQPLSFESLRTLRRALNVRADNVPHVIGLHDRDLGGC